MRRRGTEEPTVPLEPARPTRGELRGCLPGSVLLTYEDAEVALRFGRTYVKELVERGVLVKVGEGKATRITAASVRRYAAQLEAKAQQERGLQETGA